MNALMSIFVLSYEANSFHSVEYLCWLQYPLFRSPVGYAKKTEPVIIMIHFSRVSSEWQF